MYIKFTKSELQHINDIKKEYSNVLQDLSAKISKSQGEEMRGLLQEQLTIVRAVRSKIREYVEELQAKRFEKIRKRGKKAVIENAKEQIPVLLKMEYEAVQEAYSHLREEYLPEHLETLEIGTVENGKIVLFMDYVVHFMSNELKFHLNALTDYPEDLQELIRFLYISIDQPFVRIDATIKDFSDLFNPQEPPEASTKNKRLPDIFKYHIMNDMTALNLVKYNADEITGQMTLVWDVNDKKTEPVAVSLSYDNPNIAYTKKLTEFDKDMIDAVSTLFYHWERTPENKDLPVCPPLIITPAHIWRTMNGKDINDHMARPSARQIQRICDSMDKLRTTLISIDYIKDLRESGFNVKPGIDRTRQSYMIKADKDIEKKNTGKNSIVYIVSEAPFLYRYNSKKGHVLLVDYKLLNITGIESKAKKNTTEYMQEFKSYLLRRITLMRRGILSNKHIKLDTIYTETDTKEPAYRIKKEDYANEATYKQQIRAEKRRDCDTIRHILGEWVNQGFIKGYTEDKEGRGGAVTGFCIDYDIEPVGEKANAILENKKAAKKTKKK